MTHPMYDLQNYFWQGEKIRLRPLSLEDWQGWYEDSFDTDGVRMLQLELQLPPSEEMGKEFAKKYANYGNSDVRIMFSLETLAGELVGGINIHSMDKKNGTFSCGLRIHKSHRQKGYGEEALRIILRYGFYEQRYQKCNSSCVDYNEGSIKLHRRVGFKEEGRQRRSLYLNGKYHDMVLFGITREEFDKNDEEYLAARGR